MNSTDEIEIKLQRMAPLGGPTFSEVMTAVKDSFDVEPGNFTLPPQFLETARRIADQLPAMKLMQVGMLHLLTGSRLPEKRTVDYLHALLVENDLEIDPEEPIPVLANRIVELMMSCLSYVVSTMPEDSQPKLTTHLEEALLEKLSKRDV